MSEGLKKQKMDEQQNRDGSFELSDTSVYSLFAAVHIRHRTQEDHSDFNHYKPQYTAPPKMATLIKIDWKYRFNTIVELFDMESLAICQLELRALLAYPRLPRYYRIRCLILLVQCEDDWYKSKVNTLKNSKRCDAC